LQAGPRCELKLSKTETTCFARALLPALQVRAAPKKNYAELYGYITHLYVKRHREIFKSPFTP
jgi:hypothetical protein